MTEVMFDSDDFSAETLGAEETLVVERRSWKVPIVFASVLVLLAALYAGSPRDGHSVFLLGTESDFWVIPRLELPGMITAWVTVSIMLAMVVVAFILASLYKKAPWYVSFIFGAAAIWGFLAWAGAGVAAQINVISLIAGSLAMAVPLVFGALGGVIGERSGVVNVAIEAQLLMAAFTAALVATLTGSAWVGLLAAVVAGFIVACLLGLFAIKYHVNHVIVGVVTNVLVTGLTTFLFQRLLVPNQLTMNNTEPLRFSPIAIRYLHQIPIVGPILFNQTIIGYMMFVAVAAVAFALYRTRWGLRTRAVGEKPKAADTMGVNVNGTRWRAVLIAGSIVGIGGAYFTLVSNGRFNWEMTAGLGFISLAAVIFGGWNPIRAALAGLLFGFAMNLNNILALLNTPVPSQFLLMLPYAVTLFAVAGLVGKSKPPAAVGTHYSKE